MRWASLSFLIMLLISRVALATCVGSGGAPFNCTNGNAPQSADFVLGGSNTSPQNGETVRWTWGQVLAMDHSSSLVTPAAGGAAQTLANWVSYLPGGGGATSTLSVTTTPPCQSGLTCSENTITTAFNWSFSQTSSPMSFTIGPNVTYGQPASGYVYNPGAIAHYTYGLNKGGWNNSTSGNSGRSGGVIYRTIVDNQGQGDFTGYNCHGTVTGTRAGATSYLANPAVTCFNGDMAPNNAGDYLNPYEMQIADNGYDSAAAGIVYNFTRTNITEALGANWIGIRMQSIGTEPLDAYEDPYGLYNIVLDTTSVNLGGNEAAATLAANQRIFFNASNSGCGFSSCTSTGSTNYIDYNPTVSAIAISGNFYVSGSIEAGTGQVTSGNSQQVVDLGGLCTASGSSPQTCNGQRGIVTTGTLTTATSSAATPYVIDDSSITSSSLIECKINGYSGTIHTNGVPLITQCVPGNGIVTVQIQNVDTSAALNGTVAIGFLVAN